MVSRKKTISRKNIKTNQDYKNQLYVYVRDSKNCKKNVVAKEKVIIDNSVTVEYDVVPPRKYLILRILRRLPFIGHLVFPAYRKYYKIAPTRHELADDIHWKLWFFSRNPKYLTIEKLEKIEYRENMKTWERIVTHIKWWLHLIYLIIFVIITTLSIACYYSRDVLFFVLINILDFPPLPPSPPEAEEDINPPKKK